MRRWKRKAGVVVTEEVLPLWVRWGADETKWGDGQVGKGAAERRRSKRGLRDI